MRGTDVEAEAIVFLDQTVQLGDASPRPERDRLRVRMSKVDGRWLISGVDAL